MFVFGIPNRKADTVSSIATCGECGRSWDDSKVTSMTPAPSARCPFEAFHDGEDVPADFPVKECALRRIEVYAVYYEAVGYPGWIEPDGTFTPYMEGHAEILSNDGSFDHYEDAEGNEVDA